MKKDYTKEEQAWIDSRPEKVRKVIFEYPPVGCYRSKLCLGHYTIHAYEENFNGTVTLKLDHLPDSFLPGHRVFGVPPATLVPCGCRNKK